MDESKWIATSKSAWGNFSTLAIALGAIFKVDTPTPDQFSLMGETVGQLVASAFAIGAFVFGLIGRWKAKLAVTWLPKPKASLNAHAIVSLLAIVLVMGVMSLSGCAYLNRGAAASVDVAKAYCANNTVLGREVVRQGLHNEAVAEDIEFCLGCPGEADSYCTGPDKNKVPDPLSTQ